MRRFQKTKAEFIMAIRQGLKAWGSSLTDSIMSLYSWQIDLKTSWSVPSLMGYGTESCTGTSSKNPLTLWPVSWSKQMILQEPMTPTGENERRPGGQIRAKKKNMTTGRVEEVSSTAWDAPDPPEPTHPKGKTWGPWLRIWYWIFL